MPTGNGDELLARAAALVPVLRERAAETERRRWLAEETVRDLRAAGLLRAVVPKRFGGHEIGWDALLAIISELGRGCGSTSWVYGVWTDHSVYVGQFPEAAQEEVWGDNEDAVIGSGLAPTSGTATRTDGGYLLSGLWRYSSGIDHADWTFAGGMVAPESDGGAPEARFFLLPRSDYTVIDEWHVMGLAGSGSKNFEVEELFVPAYRTINFADQFNGISPGAEVNPGPLYRMPHASMAYALAAPAIGIAQGALEMYVELMRNRMRRGTRVADHETIQARLAEAAAEIDSAVLLSRRDGKEVMEVLSQADALDPMLLARLNRDRAYVVTLATRAVDRLFASTGALGILQATDIQRMFRDVHAVGAHVTNSWDNGSTAYGREVFGTAAPTQSYFLQSG